MSPNKKVYATKKGHKNSSYRIRDKGKRKLRNRFQIEGDSEDVSASAKKLRMSKGQYHVNVNQAFGYRLIEFLSVFSALSELVVCKQCGSDLKFQETSVRGLGFKLAVCCSKCEPRYINSCPLIGHGFEINRRIVLAMRILGVGLNGISKFCAFMCLPSPVFKSFYTKLIKTISIATSSVCQMSMKNAAAKEKELSEKDGETSGLTVSGDGTWKRRGFSSLLGATSLIGWRTGKIMDLEVKSKICKSCDIWEKKEGTAEYEEWKETHHDKCERNHQGSSGKMEVDAVIEMFQRSESLHGTKYSKYIGDGDSKTFKGIIDSQPYEDLIVQKKECIDHVQKRMGKHLRSLVKNTKGLGGKGKLTGKLIDELTMYYGLAIRRNSSSLEDMKREIWATLNHKISTNDKPQHSKCPVGPDSWCSWQKAKATGELKDYNHKPAMEKEIFVALKPVYTELSRDDLLQRCLGGFTQNANESFNATLWQMAPKTVHSGKSVVDIAADIAACNFNDGMMGIMEIMQVLNLEIGPTCYNFCLAADAERTSKAEERLTDAAKEARRCSLATRKHKDFLDDNAEGQMYGAGIAD